ncbi:MAG TPA: universal stress protein [Acidimicrobiales bacterium]|jgi:nucleotide-binding universal stress UspA family protein
MPYQVIVVGTDGSGRAGVAVHKAMQLAQLTGGTVHAVNAMHATVVFEDPHSAQLVMDDMRKHAEAIKEQVLEDARRQGVTVEFHSATSEPAEALVELAERLNADLVVVGNRGMSGMKRFVLGSVPNRVSHRCPCSVLIVETERYLNESDTD